MRTTLNRFSRTLAVGICLALTAAMLNGFGSGPFGSFVRPAAASGDATPCRVNDPNSQACLGPSLSVLDPSCPTFSNGQQWFDATDVNGVPQQATLSNGSHACMRARYVPKQFNLGLGAPACFYRFYVPSHGFANAKIFFGWWDQNNVKFFAAPLDESSADGWVTLDMRGQPGAPDHRQAIGVTRIEFQDNNGQSGTYIGWGKFADHGIDQEC